jgi:phage-related protein
VVGRAEVDVHADLSPFRRELTAAAARAGRDYGDTLANNLDKRLQRTTRIFDRFWGSTLRGSRNDFLNFVGVVSAGIERLTGNIIGRGLGFIANSFTRLGDVISRFPNLIQFGNGFRTIGDNIRGLGAGGIDGLIIQLAAMVIAFEVGVAVLGVFAAGVSTLTAGITALTIGIGGALFGGIVALTPAVGALVAGIAALAIGFTDLSDAQKATFAPLGELLDTVRDAVQGQLFNDLGDQVNGLLSALGAAGPFLVDLAGAFRGWVNDVISEIGPGGPLDATFRSLGESLPVIFRQLLDLLSNLGGSLVGLFDAASPAAERLLDSINGVLGRFNDWVNSVEGQEAINDFLQRALDLLGLLFGIAGEVGTALRNLWTEGGADAAQVLLSNIQDIVAEFNTWISDEGGREALLTWFRDGVRAIQDIGNVLGAVITLFDALDTTFTRAGFTVFLDFLSTAILWLADMATRAQEVILAVIEFGTGLVESIGGAFTTIQEIAASVWDALVTGFGQVVAAGQGLIDFFAPLGELFSSLAAAGAELRDGLVGAFGDMLTAVGDFVRAAIQLLIDFSDPLVSTETAVQRFRDGASAAFSGLATGIGAALRRAATTVTNFATRVGEAFGRFVRSVGSALSRAVSTIGSFAGRVGNAFSNLAGRIGQTVGRVIGTLGRLAGAAGSALGRFVSAIQRGVSRALTALGNFASRALTAISRLPALFASIGISMMQGLFNGIVSRGESIISYLQGLAQRAASTFAGILGIASPSKVFEEFGKNIVEGLVAGLGEGIGEVTDATNSLANAALPGNLNTSVSGLADQSFNPTTGGAPVRSTTDVGGITIVTPYANPRLVAIEVMDELAARGK